jgi:hypothetical protein
MMKHIVLAFLLAASLLANPVAAEDVKTVRPEDVGLSSPRIERINGLIRSHIEEK